MKKIKIQLLRQHDKVRQEEQPITGGIFYCRYSAGFIASAFNKLSCNLTGQYSEIDNKTYHQTLAEMF